MRVAILALAVLATGCDRREIVSPPDLTNQVESIQKGLNDLSARVTSNRMEAIATNMRIPGATVEFDPRDTTGYQQAASPIGPVLVRLDKIEPYLDGYNLTFLIGNPSTARLSGMAGTVKWGVEIDWKDASTLDRVQEKKFDLPTEFQSGAWTAVKLTVGPAKPDQIRRIILAPSFNAVSLRSPVGPATQ